MDESYLVGRLTQDLGKPINEISHLSPFDVTVMSLLNNGKEC